MIEMTEEQFESLQASMERLQQLQERGRETYAALVASINHLIGCLIEEGVIGPDDVPLIPAA